MAARQTTESLGTNPAFSTMIMMHCRIIVQYLKKKKSCSLSFFPEFEDTIAVLVLDQILHAVEAARSQA